MARGHFAYGISPFFISSYWVKNSGGYIDLEDGGFRVPSPEIKNLRTGFTPTGQLSKNSRKKILHAAAWLMILARKKAYKTKSGKIINYRVSMITLTLPAAQKHPDKIIVSKILSPWLTNMRNNYDLRNYIWRAEKQRNGNIHFHILTDTALDYFTVLKTWNKRLWFGDYIMDFRRNNPGKNYPSGVDVVRFTSKNSAYDYVGKYVSKSGSSDVDDNHVTCRHYALSYSLSKIQDVKSEWRDIAEMIDCHWRSRHAERIEVNEYCSIRKINLIEFLDLEPDFKIELLNRMSAYGIEPSKVVSNYYKNPNQNVMNLM